MLRISTVVDECGGIKSDLPLEVLRISTVVDFLHASHHFVSFGSAKNFYCCRFLIATLSIFSFGSAKNFYCCRSEDIFAVILFPLEVLRISTVVDCSTDRRHPSLWKC